MIDKTWGHGYYGCAGCCGYEAAQLTPNPMGGGVSTGTNDTADAHDMCNNTWPDVTSETYDWASTNPGIVIIANAYSKFMSPGTVTGSGQVQLQLQLAREECPDGTFEPQNTQQTVCAYPTNFQQTSVKDIGGGQLAFTYSWASSTGKLSDLSACTVSEIVSYPGSGGTYNWPSPPFPASPARTRQSPPHLPLRELTGASGILSACRQPAFRSLPPAARSRQPSIGDINARA